MTCPACDHPWGEHGQTDSRSPNIPICNHFAGMGEPCACSRLPDDDAYVAWIDCLDRIIRGMDVSPEDARRRLSAIYNEFGLFTRNLITAGRMDAADLVIDALNRAERRASGEVQ